MTKDPLLYIEDILESIELIASFVEGFDKARFLADVKTQFAVNRALEIMGEAVKRLPHEFRESHPEIPWKQIAGARDVLIHEYDVVNLHLIWDILQNDLPPLLDRLKALLDE